jgi:hypothetical protein
MFLFSSDQNSKEMPKSKEFVESSDSDETKAKHGSDSDGETTTKKKSTATAKKSKAKSSAQSDDVNLPHSSLAFLSIAFF